MQSPYRTRKATRACLSAIVFFQIVLLTTAFIPNDKCNVVSAHRSPWRPRFPSSEREPSTENAPSKNTIYIEGLLDNLTGILDKYILTGSPATLKRAYNVMEQIDTLAEDRELVLKAQRMIKRAGIPLQEKKEAASKIELGRTDDAKRREEAEQRARWEASRSTEAGETGDATSGKVKGRSALSRRATTNGKPDIFLGQVDSGLDPQKFAKDKADLEKVLGERQTQVQTTPDDASKVSQTPDDFDKRAASKVSQIVARTGAGNAFEGETMGIGGLDDVLSQVKRRVWTPLAAPPQLLQDLGIHPVRGLLLYGKPGCGKTLLARKLGQILSPLRPITVVSGPEVMDKFVGSSEKNLREIFDNPPGVYDFYRLNEKDSGKSLDKAALHVIIMDEFDAIARSRGGRGGSGDQGDAGVARDSVVNQFLAKMDGVDPLPVPTLVIGLTNKRSLIDPALLRSGRFEVQLEVPPPKTTAQRVSILKVHTKHMHDAGRLLVRDAAEGSVASKSSTPDLPSYEELLERLAAEGEGFSGASLAAIARAAASHALERAVEQFASHPETGSLIEDCVVTQEDFASALQDIRNSLGSSDWAEDENVATDEKEEKDSS